MSTQAALWRVRYTAHSQRLPDPEPPTGYVSRSWSYDRDVSVAAHDDAESAIAAVRAVENGREWDNDEDGGRWAVTRIVFREVVRLHDITMVAPAVLAGTPAEGCP